MKRFFGFAVRNCAVALCLVATSVGASAAIVSLNIDPTQSSMSLTGAAFGLAYNPQTAGATSASLSGSLTADLSGGSFTFSSGSAIVVDTNPNGPFTTAPNPVGVIPGNYGVTAAGFVSPFGTVTVNGVYRNLILDITAGTAQNGLAMSGGILKFSAGQLVFGAATQFAGDVPGTSNINAQGNNTAGGSVSWDGTTLTLPILFVTTGSNGRLENWNGSIVARVVPEPSSLALVSLLGLTAMVRRRQFTV